MGYPDLPDVPIVRVVAGRSHPPHERIRGAALPDHHLRDQRRYDAQQRRSAGPTTVIRPSRSEVRVGIMGFGVLGQDAPASSRSWASTSPAGAARRRAVEGFRRLRATKARRISSPAPTSSSASCRSRRIRAASSTGRCSRKLARDGPLGGPILDQCRTRRAAGRGRHPRLPRRRHPQGRDPRRVRDRAAAGRDRRSGPTRPSRSRRTMRRRANRKRRHPTSPSRSAVTSGASRCGTWWTGCEATSRRAREPRSCVIN